EGDAKFPDFQVVRAMEQDNPATREQGAERPGRHSDGPSPHNSAYDETDWHKLNKARFAEENSGAALQAGPQGRLRGDRYRRSTAATGRNTPQAAQGSHRQGKGRNPQDTDQPACLGHRTDASGRVTFPDLRIALLSRRPICPVSTCSASSAVHRPHLAEQDGQ